MISLSRRARASLIVCVSALLLVLAPLPRAFAGAPPGPTTFTTGFTDTIFENPASAKRLLWLRRAKHLGATWIRIGAPWSAVAPGRLSQGFNASNPSDPRYNWSILDGPVESAAAQGLRIVLVIAGTPTWAIGAHMPVGDLFPGAWRPNPKELGAFAHALAKRYSGTLPDPQHKGRMLPVVTHFQVWNEPNLTVYLAPQWLRSNRGRYTPEAPVLYRQMLNDAYAGITTAQPHAFVLAAGTAPYGEPPGGQRMAPEYFDRELLCLHGNNLAPERCPQPAHFDALDHHPYAPNPWYSARVRGDISVPNLARLRRLLAVAQRRRRALPVGPAKQVWVTEIDWSSRPPTGGDVSLSTQQHYLDLAFYQFWRQGVNNVLWYELADPSHSTSIFAGGGVYFSGGRSKPSAAAFRFPFVAVRQGGPKLTLWGRAPGTGAVRVERRRNGSWIPVVTVPTTRGGVFYHRTNLSGKITFRARLGTLVSPAWTSV